MRLSRMQRQSNKNINKDLHYTLDENDNDDDKNYKISLQRVKFCMIMWIIMLKIMFIVTIIP